MFVGYGSDEIESEMAHDGHVECAMALSEARLVVVEDDVEGPVQSVLDQPVAAHGVSGPFGCQLCGGDEVSRVEAASILQSGARGDAHDGCGVGQAQFTGKATLALEPAGLVADSDGALLDAAMGLVEIDGAVEAVGGSVVEIVLDLGSECGLVGLDGQQIVAP